MDSAYRNRAAHQEKKERDAVRHPVSGEEMELGEHDRSLAEISGDREVHDSFYNHYLYQQNSTEAKDIVDSLASNTLLTPKQTTFLEKHRKGFNLLSAHIEKIQEGLTPQEMQHIASVDPHIAKVLGQINPEEAAELFSKEMGKLAMDDTKRFNKIVQGMQKLHAIRTGDDARVMDQNLKLDLQQYGLSEQQYNKATEPGLGDPRTRENLQQTVADQYGGFKKALDFLTLGSFSNMASWKLNMNFEDQQRLLAECDVHLKSVGRVLQGTLTPDMRAAIQKHMIEGAPVEENDKSNVRTALDLRRVKDEFAQLAVKGRYNEYYKAEERRILSPKSRRGGSLSAAETDQIKDRFAGMEEQKIKDRKYKGSGLMQLLIGFIFGMDKAAIRAMV